MPKILIGSPVRNRGWVLPRHLEAILKQDVDMQFCYILNDSTDNTEDILKQYNINYAIHNFSELKTQSELRGIYSYQNLAVLRNRLIDEFLRSDCDYLFSCDTDIIIPYGSLQQLIDDDKDIVSMLIKNHPMIQAWNVLNNYQHFVPPQNQIIECDITGAVYLIHRRVLESGVRYRYHVQGEDVPWCEQAKEKGFKLYCDTRLKPIHNWDERTELIAE